MKKAFTLIELLAVVVIIAIIATIGIYSVTRIINQARIDSLEKTALGIRKAAALYVSSNSDVTYPKTLDLTPVGGNPSEASLIELSKDPWGKEYQKVEVTITRVGNKYQYLVVIELQNGDVYYLLDGSSKIAKAEPLTGVTISGTTQVGSTLTANVAPIGASATYQWQRCTTTNANSCTTNIPGATSSTYTLTINDGGQRVRVIATGNTVFNPGETTSTITNQVSIALSGVAISGNTSVGNTLTTVLSPNIATATYQWEISDNTNGPWSNIAEATSSTYTIVQSQAGKHIRVSATGSNFTIGSANSTSVAISPWITVSSIYVYFQDLPGVHQWRTAWGSCVAPQCNSKVLVSPQVNTGDIFSAYPAQNACKSVGGRLPSFAEFLSISGYISLPEPGDLSYWLNREDTHATTYHAFIYFDDENPGFASNNWWSGWNEANQSKTNSMRVRCVKD